MLCPLTCSSKLFLKIVNRKGNEFYQTRYDLTGNESDFDAQVAAKIAEETDLFAFAADALAAAKDAGITPGKETA